MWCGCEYVMVRMAEAEAAARDVAERIRASGRMDYDVMVVDVWFDVKYLEMVEGGKMIGVLVGRWKMMGERVTLKAFSG